MTRLIRIVVFLLSSAPAFAMPQFLELYRTDPFRNPAVDGCNTCHMRPDGGGERNEFGRAFESAGKTITPMLRAQFPDRFVYPTSKVGDNVTIHFSDPNNQQMVMETAGGKSLVDITKRSVDGHPAAAAANAPAGAGTPAASASAPAQEPKVPVDPLAREGAFFGSNVVNLPDGKPQKKGGVDFWIGHRFSQDIQAAGVGGLFGFDSAAAVAFGARVGLTNHLSVSILRSNLFQTVSLSAAYQLSRQSEEFPITLQFRAGVDGQHNFGLYSATSANPRQYSPFLQMVATRTFKDRVSFTMSPIFAGNTRNEAAGDNIPGQGFGTSHNNTVSLGLGAGVRFLPTVSLVGEYIPRVWGFRGEDRDSPGVSTDRSGVSIGLQKSTFRHTFELVVSRQLPLTPVQVALQGGGRFMIGFNIYRKIR